MRGGDGRRCQPVGSGIRAKDGSSSASAGPVTRSPANAAAGQNADQIQEPLQGPALLPASAARMDDGEAAGERPRAAAGPREAGNILEIAAPDPGFRPRPRPFEEIAAQRQRPAWIGGRMCVPPGASAARFRKARRRRLQKPRPVQRRSGRPGAGRPRRGFRKKEASRP